MIDRLKKFIKTNSFFRSLFFYCKYIVNTEERKSINQRIQDILSSSDNDYIPRVANAGRVKKGKLIMHNGIEIAPIGYYGYSRKWILMKNLGVHEPQEERAFSEVLKFMPENATMLELGSHWAFYSMWFCKEVKNANSYIIEPNDISIQLGKKNFTQNQMKGTFYKAYVSSKSNANELNKRTISIDDFVEEHSIDFVHILHSNIKGFELEMLNGALQLIKNKKVGYFFISAHSNQLHYSCIDFLKQHQFTIVAQADMEASFSYDGLIVAKAPYFNGVDSIIISKRNELPKYNFELVKKFENQLLINSGTNSINKTRKYISYQILKRLSNLSKKENATLGTTFWGKKMKVIIPEIVSNHIFLKGYFDEDVVRMILYKLKDGMTFIDVGAHFGFMTLLASQLVGNKGQVYSFEPTPNTFSILKWNVKDLKNVKPYQLAASNAATELEFFDYGFNFSAFNTLGKIRTSEQTPTPNIHKVKTVALDEFFKQQNIIPNLIKIDAENSEHKILLGLQKTISSLKPMIIVEVGDTNDDGNSKAIVEYLIKNGYKALELQNKQLVNHVTNKNSKYEYKNILFIP